ncbi:MAG: hypothetical protein QM778_23310 [Myxococcales bacterium]
MKSTPVGYGRTRTQAAWLLGVLALGSFSDTARADSIFSLSGKVALGDGGSAAGTRVQFQVDSDRNGKLESWETLSAKVGADGKYVLAYELNPTKVDFQFIKIATQVVAEYEKGGFDGLLSRGPLPVVMSFEREGYTTVVRRFGSMSDAFDLDAVLAPLPGVHCDEASCFSEHGDVRLADFPGGTGIARAYASAYDPDKDLAQFPGTFSDDADNLLISSGFAEINLYDSAGQAIHEVSSPVAVRFEAKRAQWKTMPDLAPNSGKIELPMYSFDRNKADWVREADGVLELADGTPVPEESLPAIRMGTFAEPVFVAFDTLHFSSFNCDAPISERACVRGRLVDDATGEALIGADVSVLGVSYTGSAGRMFTGQDGRFAVDVMKSENPGEDTDRNGTAGETFNARLSVRTAAGVFLGAAFDTPILRGSAQLNECRPGACACLDLGDIPVKFEVPRLCNVTVRATASGKNLFGGAGPLETGAAVVGAEVRGELSGEFALPQAAVSAVCEGVSCGAGTVGADGAVSFAVPMVGDAGQLQFHADFSVVQDGTTHVYSGSVAVAGCAAGQEVLAAPVSIELDHGSAGSLDAFIRGLGDEAASERDPGGSEVLDSLGCGCRIPASPTRSRLGALAGLALASTLLWRRHGKRRAKASRDQG